jgi:signal transduction histidine kinase
LKTLRAYILADTLLLAALGLGMAFIHPGSFPMVYLEVEVSRSAASLGFVAAGLGALALVLWLSTDLPLVADRRRLALGLSFANLLIAAVAFLQTDLWGRALAWSLVAAFLGLAAGLAWTGLRTRKPAEIAAEIAALKIPDEIRQGLLRQIEEAAAQEERNRLARDLHNSIKQQLFSINVGAAAAQERWERDPEGARKALADVRRSAREAMVEMQAMLHQLRPEALSTAGLIEALREQCEALSYRSGSEVTLELGEPVPDDRMPPGAPEALFRMAQEMLANVARHARARRVRLWLERQDEKVKLRIEDDGQGFTLTRETAGMGLRNLKERAASLDGEVEIVSSPGTGTRVAVYIPLISPPNPAQPAEVAWLSLWETVQMIAFASLTLLYRRAPFLQSQNAYLPLLILAAVILRELFQHGARPLHPNVDRYMRCQSMVLGLLFASYFWSANAKMPWISLSIVSIFLIVSMVQLYRVSEVRRFWRKESPLWLWMVLLTAMGILLRLGMAAYEPLRFALTPAQATSLLILGAGFIYVASLRPRMGGTLS